MMSSRAIFLKAAAATSLALAALGSASVAEARVFVSVGANIAPGISIGLNNGYYPQQVYVQPAPVYYQPAPVYYEPVYYQPQTYFVPAPLYYAPPVFGVTYGRPWGGHRHHHRYYR